MGIKWTKEQICALLNKARTLYETEIPLAREISHLESFIWEMSTFAGKEDSFRFKIHRVVFSWFHRGRTKSEEIDIPADIAWKVYHEARALLDAKCNRLTDMLGLDKRTIKKKQKSL